MWQRSLNVLCHKANNGVLRLDIFRQLFWHEPRDYIVMQLTVKIKFDSRKPKEVCYTGDVFRRSLVQEIAPIVEGRL